MAENQGALSWDSQIEQESSFVLLPEGDYDFVVEKMERGMYQPSPQAKIREACPEAELTLKIQSSEGEATVKERLILHTATEWKISEFFIAIGQKPKGSHLLLTGVKCQGQLVVQRLKSISTMTKIITREKLIVLINF